jgi:hypothetical protein
MNSIYHCLSYRMLVFFTCCLVLVASAAARVIEDGKHIYLLDQTGERWDITQAVSIGFEPHSFEFGIGRNAFRPLEESDWTNDEGGHERNFRVIGISDGEEAHAYSVSKLSRHEIANTMLASDPIAAGY